MTTLSEPHLLTRCSFTRRSCEAPLCSTARTKISFASIHGTMTRVGGPRGFVIRLKITTSTMASLRHTKAALYTACRWQPRVDHFESIHAELVAGAMRRFRNGRRQPIGIAVRVSRSPQLSPLAHGDARAWRLGSAECGCVVLLTPRRGRPVPKGGSTSCCRAPTTS
jgi:hypothetical protein